MVSGKGTDRAPIGPPAAADTWRHVAFSGIGLTFLTRQCAIIRPQPAEGVEFTEAV